MKLSFDVEEALRQCKTLEHISGEKWFVKTDAEGYDGTNP